MCAFLEESVCKGESEEQDKRGHTGYQYLLYFSQLFFFQLCFSLVVVSSVSFLLASAVEHADVAFIACLRALFFPVY
jgi:hypothetical protein